MAAFRWRWASRRGLSIDRGLTACVPRGAGVNSCRFGLRPAIAMGELALADKEFIFGVTPFYFLRHGETLENETGIVQGQSDTELSARGRKTAERAGSILPSLGLGSIYTSPLKRAWETAVISRASLQTPIFFLSGLMERHWGPYEGQPKHLRPIDEDPDGAETYDDFRGRVLTAMRFIRGPSPVLVVAHSGVFRVIYEHTGHEIAQTVSVGNAEVLKFEPPTGQRRTWKVSMA